MKSFRRKILLVLILIYLVFFYFKGVVANDLININTANLEELDTLPGIGATYAQRIIDYREANGNFQAIEDIKNVSGIGDVTFDKIKELITVGEAEEENESTQIQLVDINIADMADFESLPGIGSGKAQAIIDYRSINGKFQTIEEIMNVSGIGEATFNNIKDFIFVLELDETTDNFSENLTEEENNNANETGSKIIETVFAFGDVVINEFVSDPADNEVEFVELYNKTGADIDLSGWYIYEGSEGKTSLSGQLEKFAVVEKIKGSLNNSGDIITLKFGETIIDQVAYGDWDDGDISNNAPSASDPESVARKGDGFHTFNPANDFAVTNTVTKNTSNIILNNNISELDNSFFSYEYSTDIIISEIFPNPFGSDNEEEFIELFNKGDQSVNLQGWALSDSTNSNYKLADSELIIEPKSYFVVYRKNSRLALNNTSDSVELYQPASDNVLQKVEYSEAKEGWSYSLASTTGESLNYFWTEVVTPKNSNIIQRVNHKPLVDFSFNGNLQVGQIIYFDSSDTIDEDNDKLNFEWNFGGVATSSEPNPIFIFLDSGIKQVSLKVSDGEYDVDVEKLLEISLAQTQNIAFSLNDTKSHNDVSLPIIISELLPNPEGADADGEWIELQNTGSVPIDLNNWRLDDEEGGSSPFVIKNLAVNAGDFFVFDRSETNIALNNSIDSVRLFNATGELINEVSYNNAKEGWSYVLSGNSWHWSSDATPGAENSFVFNESQPSVVARDLSGKSSASFASAQTTLEHVREYEKGDQVLVEGVVAVEPGTFGVQYFYIVGSPGIQVYNYNKLFPDIHLGDKVLVSGELSESYGELRLKTKSAEDIKFIATSTLPAPIMTEADKIGESMEGWLVRVKGEVVKKSGSTIYLDDGTNEAEIYLKQGAKINKSNINEGDIITVIGIITQKNEVYRIFPRSQDDIIIEGAVLEGEVLGVVSENDEWSLAQNNKKLKLTRYLLVVCVGLIVVLMGIVWKGRR